MRICICDDNEVMHQEIRKCLQPFFTEADMPQITDFFQGEELVEHYSSQKDFDIIFLDIEMGKMNGIDTATEVRKHAPEAIIIFVSSHRNYVFDAFRCEAFHFLVKPISQEEFDDVFNRALHKHRVMNEKYLVCWKNTRQTLMIGDITYIEGYKRRLKVHIVGEEYEHRGKVSDAYEKLKAHGFLRPHQGYVINMRHIKSFGSTEIILRDGSKIPIGEKRRKEVLQMYDKYIQKWKW